jgi:hypothetical protein
VHVNGACKLIFGAFAHRYRSHLSLCPCPIVRYPYPSLTFVALFDVRVRDPSLTYIALFDCPCPRSSIAHICRFVRYQYANTPTRQHASNSNDGAHALLAIAMLLLLCCYCYTDDNGITNVLLISQSIDNRKNCCVLLCKSKRWRWKMEMDGL